MPRACSTRRASACSRPRGWCRRRRGGASAPWCCSGPPHTAHCHTVHLALGALLRPCTVCGTGAAHLARAVRARDAGAARSVQGAKNSPSPSPVALALAPALNPGLLGVCKVCAWSTHNAQAHTPLALFLMCAADRGRTACVSSGVRAVAALPHRPEGREACKIKATTAAP